MFLLQRKKEDQQKCTGTLDKKASRFKISSGKNCFIQFITRMACLAASDLFYMFIQSIHMFIQSLFVSGFILKPTERA